MTYVHRQERAIGPDSLDEGLEGRTAEGAPCLPFPETACSKYLP